MANEDFLRHYNEEEFLAEFGSTPVVAAVVAKLKPRNWTPNPSANDGTRRLQKLETDDERLKQPRFQNASTYAFNGKLTSVQTYFIGADLETVVRVSLEDDKWVANREDHEVWGISWSGIDADVKKKVLNELEELGIKPGTNTPIMMSESFPTFIDFATNLPGWQAALGAGAALYFKKYLETLATDHVNSRKKVYEVVRKAVGHSATKLVKFVKLLRDNCRANPRDVKVSISFPTERVRFDLPLDDEDEALAVLARTTANLGMVSAAAADMKERIPVNMPATATVSADGFTLTWWDELTWSARGQKYGNDGKPIGVSYAINKES